MSQVTDDFFTFLIPVLEAEGFTLLKSKKTFVKKQNEFVFQIFLKFDGRGGLVFLNWIDIFIFDKQKQLIKMNSIRSHYFEGDIIKLKISTLYSQKALDLANNMNLRALGQMEYYEKYPKDRIEKSAMLTIALLQKEVLPIINEFIKMKSL